MRTVILCGGSGTRLWPISTNKLPKQFIKIFENESLFEKTIKRNKSDSFTIIANSNHQDLVKNSLPDNALALYEEVGRNTAPAIALACLFAEPEEILLVVPSDHLINKQDNYTQAIAQAKAFAQEDKLVTFGIQPTHPETGYGYIEANGNDVLSFKEKPDLETAKSYLAKGNYFWNSGMFCFKAKVFLEELKEHAPDIYEICARLHSKITDKNHIVLKEEKLKQIRSESIDYAVMEKSKRVKVIPSDLGWSDLGSFDSLYEHLALDTDKNTKTKNLVSIDSQNNLIINELDSPIALFDVENMIIVNTKEGVLFGKRGESQKVKDLLQKIKENKLT